MTKLSTIELRRAVGREEFDYPLLVSALSQYNFVDQKIHDLLRSGTIVGVKKGLYVFGPGIRQSPIVKESFANLIYGPSCLSLEYALSFHGLIPEKVEILTSITPKKTRSIKPRLDYSLTSICQFLNTRTA